ncbi:hypothetical protein L596_002576 [Steinernema carpocapsae]|uniref:SURP motif domain-containing protein n=1 Tax=Steinernema carpocapsae TaxID=34508 RepID=A0A4U8UQ58_STECR|nr:hypothetical protein L596_002576 [Steinernema carpocapsae]
MYPAPMGMGEQPRAPPDEELKTMINRLADYIAQHGPDCEEETRRGHYGNPRFRFLFGGEYSDYYKYRLMQAVNNLHGPPPGVNVPRMPFAGPISRIPPPNFSVEATREKIETLRTQIANSHANLLAQYNSINTNKEEKIAQAVKKAERDRVFAILEKVNLNVEPFSVLMEQLETSSSKEVIQSCKNWIFENCDSDQLREVVLSYMSFRVKEDQASDAFKLNVLYVVNDWAIYVQKKRLENVRQSLSRYIPQMYAFSAIKSNDQPSSQIDKLEKLLSCWERNKTTLKQTKNPAQVKANYKLTLFSETQKAEREVTARVLADYNTYEQQHKEFEKHALAQVEGFEQQIIHYEARKAVLPPSDPGTSQADSSKGAQGITDPPRRSRFDQENKTSGPPFNVPRFDQPPSRGRWDVQPELVMTSGFFNPPPQIRGPPCPQIHPTPLKDVMVPQAPPGPSVPSGTPPMYHANGSSQPMEPIRKKQYHFEQNAGNMITAIPDDAFTYEDSRWPTRPGDDSSP